MSPCHWIVCERSNRWASALRLAAAKADRAIRIRETRHLHELRSEIAHCPQSLVAVEVHRGNFADVLLWLSSIRKQCTSFRSIALLDHSLAGNEAEVSDVLFEAGVSLVATSPRRMREILPLGESFSVMAAIPHENESFAAQVWASLPWQSGQ